MIANPLVVPMMCPTINSYKRLLGGEAMWAPDTASYGYESRAASIRIICPPGAGASATRFEVRVPGADVSEGLAQQLIADESILCNVCALWSRSPRYGAEA